MKHSETLTDIAPDQEAELTYLPEWQNTPFVIRDLAENLAPMAEQLMRQDATRPVKQPKPVEAPQAPAIAPNQYIDYSEVPSRQMARMKLRAQVYDVFHKTNMYGLLVDKLNEDRDVAFARELGLISTTHCLKHEKAVSKLRGML